MAAGEGGGLLDQPVRERGCGNPRWSWKTGEDCPDPPALLCISSTHGSYVISHGFTVFVFCVCVQSLSRVRLFATPWTVPRQAPLSAGLSRKEFWSRWPFPPLGDLLNP